MKKMKLFLSLSLLLFLASCNKDDDNLATLEVVYSYTIETSTDMSTIKNTDDATKLSDLFFKRKWFTTKTIKGNTIAQTDAKARVLFTDIVDKATLDIAKLKLNGNAILTYKCTRKGVATQDKVEIEKKQWKYISN